MKNIKEEENKIHICSNGGDWKCENWVISPPEIYQFRTDEIWIPASEPLSLETQKVLFLSPLLLPELWEIVVQYIYALWPFISFRSPFPLKTRNCYLTLVALRFIEEDSKMTVSFQNDGKLSNEITIEPGRRINKSVIIPFFSKIVTLSFSSSVPIHLRNLCLSILS